MFTRFPKIWNSGDGKGFLDRVSDDVDWIVEETHPLAWHYHSQTEFK